MRDNKEGRLTKIKESFIDKIKDKTQKNWHSEGKIQTND